MTSPDVAFMGARRLARLVRTRKLSATEVVKAFIARVESRCFETRPPP